MPKPDYDTTIARVAGNIMSGLVREALDGSEPQAVHASVRIARAIVAEVKRTELPAACATCQGRGWVTRTVSLNYGGGLGSGGSFNVACPDCENLRNVNENANRPARETEG